MTRIFFQAVYRFILTGWLIVCLTGASDAATRVRVGVFDYAPLSFSDESGHREGLFIDLLNHVAEQERWSLDYVPGSLQEGFRRLKDGEVDLLVAVPYSPQAAEQYDFTGEAVISTWAQIYYDRDKCHIQSILDLQSLSVGIVRDDPYNREIREIIRHLNIRCRFIEFNSYEEVFKAIEKKWVDAGAVDRLYGILQGQKSGIEKSHVLFSPVELRFAVPKKRNQQLVAALNYHIDELKKKEHSLYYESVERMLGSERKSKILGVLKWVLALAACILCLLGLRSWLLRRQVTRKTWELKKKNEELGRELHQRVRAEKALRESEDLYRTLANQSFAIVWVAQNGRFCFINGNATRCAGYAAAELLGKSPLHIVHEEDRPEAVKNARAMLQGRRTSPYEYRLITNTGDLRWMLETVTSIQFEGRRAVLGNAMDITEQKRAEEEKRLLESQLRQAQKMEAIGTLAGGIAHDFNNILGAIMGYSELALLDLSGSMRHRRNIEQIFKASERARDLINQILTFSRQGECTLSPLRISPLLKEVVKLLRASLPATIQIELDIRTRRDMIEADSTQIHQVMMNLCTNAAHAMQERGGTLSICLALAGATPDRRSEPGSDAAEYLELKVSDTGHGMDPAIMDRIFDPFFTTKEVGKGTGMGLAVVHGIVQSHGGQIDVESAVGKGSTFRIHFPLVTEKTVEPPKPLPERVPGGGECILFVDDERDLAYLGQEMLGRLGYEVVIETSSVRAVELFRDDPHRFDLVITDLTMPVITGADLAREVLRIRPEVPVILCTGYSELITAEEAKNIGISEYVKKPFGVRQMARLIRNLLDERGMALSKAV